ncbi:MAG: hypothetical protein IBX64_10105 [Actinobacteria bacterium]|nr:hypothetical protein [Actinomycetota bacterium]
MTIDEATDESTSNEVSRKPTTGEGVEKSTSLDVLLQYAYFLESERTKDLTNLLQRISIITAANAALIGLWGSSVSRIIPRYISLPLAESSPP